MLIEVLNTVVVKMQSLPYSGCLYSENKQPPFFVAWSLEVDANGSKVYGKC